MKKIKKYIFHLPIIIMLVAIIFFANGCKMSQPKIEEYPETMSQIEKELNFEFDKCVYAQSFVEKVNLDCKKIKEENRKIKYILLYVKLEKENKLPMIYRKNSEEIMTFDDFFKYIK